MNLESQQQIAREAATDYVMRLRQWQGYPLTEYQVEELVKSYLSAIERATELQRKEGDATCQPQTRDGLMVTETSEPIGNAEPNVQPAGSAQPQRSVTNEEVDEFMREYREGKHPLSPEFESALRAMEPRMFTEIRDIINRGKPQRSEQRTKCPSCGQIIPLHTELQRSEKQHEARI